MNKKLKVRQIRSLANRPHPQHAVIKGLGLRGITATFLGGPLKVEGETPEPGRFLIRGEGATR